MAEPNSQNAAYPNPTITLPAGTQQYDEFSYYNPSTKVYTDVISGRTYNDPNKMLQERMASYNLTQRGKAWVDQAKHPFLGGWGNIKAAYQNYENRGGLGQSLTNLWKGTKGMVSNTVNAIKNFKLQEGGAMPEGGGDVQQQIIALVQAAMQGDEQARQQIEQIMQAAQQGDPQAQQIAQMIQQVVQSMQGQGQEQAQTPQQRFGGQLSYIHKLRTGVNPDEEVIYEKCGGRIKKKVVKKAIGGAPVATETGSTRTYKKTYFESKGGKQQKVNSKKMYFGGSF